MSYLDIVCIPKEPDLKLLKGVGFILLFIIFTVLTQIGGLVLILTIPLSRLIDKKIENGLRKRILKHLSFVGLYFLTTIVIVPLIAKPFGRVPMPIFGNAHVKPLNIMTCVLNRHYVRPELLMTVENVANKMNKKHPGIVIAYLDANFPYINKFPLLPHLSHNDGKKLDLAFLYIDSTSKKQLNNDAPSFIGYGVYEKPLAGEMDKPSDCANKGYWQYSFLQNLIPQWNKDEMTFDIVRTKDLITLLAQANTIGKIFIEPHIKARMKLNHDKVRFHGCQAVRHDDHIHVQLQ